VARENVYAPIYLLMAAMLVLGLIAALLVRPVAPRWWREAPEAAAAVAAPAAAPAPARWGMRMAAWSAVLIPLGWGAWFTVQKVLTLL
jgi:hypothetical protein